MQNDGVLSTTKARHQEATRTGQHQQTPVPVSITAITPTPYTAKGTTLYRKGGNTATATKSECHL